MGTTGSTLGDVGVFGTLAGVGVGILGLLYPVTATQLKKGKYKVKTINILIENLQTTLCPQKKCFSSLLLQQSTETFFCGHSVQCI